MPKVQASEPLYKVSKRKKYTEVLSAADLQKFGYGLDRWHLVFLVICFLAFTGAMIWYAWFLDGKVKKAVNQMSPVLTTVALPVDSQGFFTVPLPAITVCMAVAPETALIDFPSADNRTAFYPEGISGALAVDLTGTSRAHAVIHTLTTPSRLPAGRAHHQFSRFDSVHPRLHSVLTPASFCNSYAQ